MSAKHRRMEKTGRSTAAVIDEPEPGVEPEDQPEEPEAEPEGEAPDPESVPSVPIEGVTAEEYERIKEKLTRLRLTAFLPDLRFTTNVDLIVPGENENHPDPAKRTSRHADERLIIERSEFLSSIPDWADQFTYVAVTSGFKGKVWFPGLHRKTIVPDLRIPMNTETINAVVANLRPYKYDPDLKQQLGKFSILDMPEVKTAGHYDPFFLKLVFESTSNAAWAGNGGTVHLFPSMRPIFEKKVAAERLRKEAEAQSLAPMNPRAVKTGRDPALASIIGRVTANQIPAPQ